MKASSPATESPAATDSRRWSRLVWRALDVRLATKLGEVQIGACPNDSGALSIVNSAELRHGRSAALSNPQMKTVEEIRRERLQALKSEFGSFAELNKRLGRTTTDSTLSQIANQSIGTKTDKPKTMGSPQARAIEDALGKPRGWMDTDPALLEQIIAWPFPEISPDEFSGLTDLQVADVQGYIRGKLSASSKGNPPGASQVVTGQVQVTFRDKETYERASNGKHADIRHQTQTKKQSG